MADKETHVKRIAHFLGIENYNLQNIIENTSIINATNRRQIHLEQAGKPFYEHYCYRTGKTNSWENSLTAETLQIYEKCFKNNSF